MFRSAAIALLGALILTGCSSPSSYEGDSGAYSDSGYDSGSSEDSVESEPLYTAENPGAGITGEVLPAYNYFGRLDLPEGDVAMYLACQYVRAFETGVVVLEGEDFKPGPKLLKEHFRTRVIVNLGLISEAYPEALIYQQGALERLADASLQPEGYLSLQRACEPYLALLDRMDAIAMEEIALLPQGCWNGSEVIHKLEIKIDGEWESLGRYTATEQEEFCSDPEFPYAPTATVQMYSQSWEFRWVNLPREGSDSFSDGSTKIIDYFTADQYGTISEEKEVRK